ncbi:MAG: GFA family protein [Rubrobacteraceae bacterium]
MMKTYHGSCHCGEIRFEADVDLDQGIRKCNCSFCLKSGYKKALIGYDELRITAGESRLQNYHAENSNWPEGDIDHYGCTPQVGQRFSRGYLEEQMGGNFWAINVACLDDVTEAELAAAPVIYEDGKRDRQDRAPEINSYL